MASWTAVSVRETGRTACAFCWRRQLGLIMVRWATMTTWLPLRRARPVNAAPTGRIARSWGRRGRRDARELLLELRDEAALNLAVPLEQAVRHEEHDGGLVADLNLLGGRDVEALEPLLHVAHLGRGGGGTQVSALFGPQNTSLPPSHAGAGPPPPPHRPAVCLARTSRLKSSWATCCSNASGCWPAGFTILLLPVNMEHCPERATRVSGAAGRGPTGPRAQCTVEGAGKAGNELHAAEGHRPSRMAAGFSHSAKLLS